MVSPLLGALLAALGACAAGAAAAGVDNRVGAGYPASMTDRQDAPPQPPETS